MKWKILPLMSRFLVILLFLSGCASTGNVEGTVMNGGQISPNITVTFEGADVESETDNQVTKTDSNGHFVFSDLDPGTYTITVPADLDGRPCIIISSVEIKAGKTSQVEFSVPKNVQVDSTLGVAMDNNGNIISCR